METKKCKKVSEDLTDKIGDFEHCMDRIREKQGQLMNFIAKSSVKLNNTNQDEIRRLVLDIVDQAWVQSNAVNCLLEKVIKQRELIEIYINKRDEAISYAVVAEKLVGRKRSLSWKREETFTALIHPTEDIDSNEIRDIVLNTIDPAKLQVGIRRLKKGGILVELNT